SIPALLFESNNARTRKGCFMRNHTSSYSRLSYMFALAAFLICSDLLSPLPGLVSAQTNPSWTFTGNLNGSRANHTATRLPGGKVLVVGGSSGSALLDTAELYD